MASSGPFHESHLLTTPIRELGLTIAGTPLEPCLEEFRQELERVGIHRLRPHFYLSNEWGVPFQTISIGIPFYLTQRDLTAVHAERTGHLEGASRSDLLRYLRHEMGHVVNYAYKLYEHEEWIKLFGSITQPYLEEYRPQPFSQQYVRHLPGWYAQKHPDEDWSETFAVWMTPDYDWRIAYADWPEALAKLNYCDRTMVALNERDPEVTVAESYEDVSDFADTLEEFYHYDDVSDEPLPPGLDGALQAIVEEFSASEDRTSNAPRQPASELLLRLELDLISNVYCWTGHCPDATRKLIRHLAERARQLEHVYSADREAAVTVALTTLITSLAMNHVYRGKYFS